MDMERLIEEVRKFPVLYDQTNEKYRNTDYKNKVWKTIATQLKTKGGVEECKKKWTSVRDQLRRTLQKRKIVSGQAAVSRRKYIYEDLLEFLLPHLIERKSLSNVADTEEVTDYDEHSDITVKEEENIDIDESESMQQNEEEDPEMKSQKTQEMVLYANTSVKSVKRKMQSQLEPQELASASMTYMLSAERTENQPKEVSRNESEKHPVDAFLAGIAPPLKSLNPMLLNQAKSCIFSIVQEYEMKQLLASQEIIRAVPSNQP
ncbi:hypothetical protein JTB14_012278 [Gonioctena quinquepunctata]|nr:hypothetical protein JTB14_012278 [Gonioctena quinquepunctata]